VAKSRNEDIAQSMEEAVNVIEGTSLSAVTDWCSTGSTALDLAISNRLPGGFPVGRVVQLFGGSSTAKSVLSSTMLGYALRSGKQAFLADVEYTMDPVFASYYGLDCKHEEFHYGYDFLDKDAKKKLKLEFEQPATIEEFFDIYLAGILKLRSRKPKVVICDTITALPSEVELAEDMKKPSFAMTRAKAISLGLRKYLGEMNRKNITLVCIDQTRDNVGGFGASETTNGGRGLEFYSSVRLHLTKDKVITNSKDSEIGIWVKYKIIKNKVAPPFRKGHFKILFDYGLDDITSILSWMAVNNGAVKEAEYLLTTQIELPFCDKCNRFIHTPDSKCDGEVKLISKRIMDWVPFIEDNNLEQDLKQILAGLWKEAYATEERKTRVW